MPHRSQQRRAEIFENLTKNSSSFTKSVATILIGTSLSNCHAKTYAGAVLRVLWQSTTGLVR